MTNAPSPPAQSKVAFITGAGDRLGKAMALALGDKGWSIAVHYNSSAQKAEAVVNALTQKGVNAQAFQADLSDEAQTDGLIAKAAHALGPISLLVNSASRFTADEALSATRESWDAHMETNLRAPFKLSQDFTAQAPKDANNPGDNLIVNLIDQRVLKLTPQFMSYTLSKAALLTLTKTLAQALGPEGVRVNGIGPGPTMRNVRQSQEDFRVQTDATVLGYGSSPGGIVDALFYLLQAREVTGQMLAVDGGQHLIWQTPDVMINE